MRSFYGTGSLSENMDGTIAQMKKTENNLLLSEMRLYGMDTFVLKQLKLIEGDLSKLYDPGSRAIAAVYIESDRGIPYMDSNWAKVGDVVTLRHTYEWEYYYTDTGEIIEEFNKSVADGSRPWNKRSKIYEDIEYTVTALVCVPYNISYRFNYAEEFVVNSETFIRDTGTDSILLYAFNTADESTDQMERFIQDYTNNVDSSLNYESKLTYVKGFEEQRNMFAMLGGILSFVVGLVGVLNFFNAVLTSIISRKREFAVMQAIGMTGMQLRQMLICERRRIKVSCGESRSFFS